jgi:aminopeptidase N
MRVRITRPEIFWYVQIMRRLIATCVASFCLLAHPAFAQRLPTGISPTHYTLWFAPDLQQRTFRGRETIDIQVAAPTRAITLNAAEITFSRVTIQAAGRSQEARVALDEKAETATFTVPQPVPAGTASIAITYTGVLNDKLRGFYISNANNRSYAVTQMEATDARRAFPSFDEPSYKATFDLSLMIDEGDTAISNGRQTSDTPGPEPRKHTVAFSTTPKMSTYLVAMLVGDFVCREGKTQEIPIRVCSAPDKLHLTQFALEAAEQQVAFYGRYFGIPYPFGKLDIIGVPDFAAGAMENTGAITFREQYLLADPEHASLKTLKDVASVTAHEIAHQWFGDLVTMKWWDDIWLNEGFATWMANKPLAEWKPEWHVELDDAAETQQALGLDVLRSTRPIRTKAETPDEINDLFDAIAYEKTAAVLRMIESYVGREPMRAGITAYLKKYSFGNAAGEDFWTEMTRATGKPVDRIMKSFVDEPGAPILTVRASCRAGTNNISVTQQRFVAASGAEAPPRQTWTLPACFEVGNAAPRCEVIDRPTQTITSGSCGDALFANASSRGYYITDYAPDGLRALTGSVGSLSPVERTSLIGDEWWMVRSGRHDVEAYLDLAAALARDDTSTIIGTLTTRLESIGNFIATGPQESRFQQWIRATFGPVLSSLGLPGARTDDDQEQSRRASLLRLVAVTGNDPDVQRAARDLAEQYLADAHALPPTLAGVVLNVAALRGDAALYARYMTQIDKLTGNPEEYYRYFNALAWFGDPVLIRRTLDFTMSSAARSQDVGSLLAGLMARPAARDATWTFIKAQWPALTKKLGTFQGIPDIVSATGNFCSLEAADDVRRFFAQNPVRSSTRTLQQAIERIESCAAMRMRQAQPLERYLEK